MKVYFKGGQWSNMEDQALLAAIQKYGDRDWGKIASMVQRKDPDSCKARWFEWLHPDIRKDDFTPEEDSRLLHLGRVFPSQWRTIASQMPGRTPGMCSDRHQELIELAENGGTFSEEFLERMRRERDWRPEARPAKKDTIDSNVYEAQLKEELTARLANKQGKKSLRRERAQQLQDTQFRTQLQRLRELAEAGAMTISQLKKSKRLQSTAMKSASAEGAGVEGDDGEDGEEEVVFTPVDFDKVWSSGVKKRVKEVQVISHLERKRLREEQEGTAGLATGLRLSSAPSPAAASVGGGKVGFMVPRALQQRLSTSGGGSTAAGVSSASVGALLPAPRAQLAATAGVAQVGGTAPPADTSSTSHTKATPPARRSVPSADQKLQTHVPPLPSPIVTPRPPGGLDMHRAERAVAVEMRRMLREASARGDRSEPVAVADLRACGQQAIEHELAEAVRGDPAELIAGDTVGCNHYCTFPRTSAAPYIDAALPWKGNALLPMEKLALAEQQRMEQGIRAQAEAFRVHRETLLQAASRLTALSKRDIGTAVASIRVADEKAAQCRRQLHFYRDVLFASEQREIRRREAELASASS